MAMISHAAWEMLRLRMTRALLCAGFFSLMSMHPDVSDLAPVSAEKRDELHKSASELFQRLILTDCRKEATLAIKYDGVGVLQSSFGFLGEIAVADLMAHPKVTQEIEKFQSYFDENAWNSLTKEAGIATAAKKSKSAD